MKCFTVTERGVTPGIAFVARDPYPHVEIGDPQVEYDFRRVEVDAALAEGAANGVIPACSVTLDMKEGDRRRVSYKLVAPNGKDEDQALVKLEAHCTASGRTFYEMPRYTLTVAKGWFSKAGGPSVNTPVELIVLNKGGEVRIYKEEDLGRPDLVYIISFDGNELRVKS